MKSAFRYFRNVLIIFIAVPMFSQTSNVRVTTNSADQSETAIALSSLNSSLFAATWNDFRSDYFSQAGYAFSTNAGSSWSEGILRAPTERSGYIYGFDPSVAFDRNGNVFYCYIATDDIRLGATYVARSTNQGSTWDTLKQVSSSALNQDKPFLAIDNTAGTYDGRIYVSWTDYSSGSKIKFAYSSDHGLTYSSSSTLSSDASNPGTYAQLMPNNPANIGSYSASFVQGSMPAVGPNGEVFVVWMNVSDGYNSSTFGIRKSTDGGSSFSSETAVTQFTWNRFQIGGLDALNLPAIAVDKNTGNVYVVFMDRVSQNDGNMRIKIARSTNAGSSWGSPSVIADLGSDKDFHPCISVDANGRISVAFYHNSSSSAVDIYLTESFDNGVNFTSPVMITSQSSDPNNSTWTHHYMGIVSKISGINYPIWTDYRNGNPDPYFSSANPPPKAPQSLAVSAPSGSPYLQWNANSESDFDHYQVWRNINTQGGSPGSFNKIADNITSTNYTDGDLDAPNGSWAVYYKVKAVDDSANVSDYSNQVSTHSHGFLKPAIGIEIPRSWDVSQNYPNPFNPSTRISYAVPEPSQVTLVVFDRLGREVLTLVNENQEPGFYEVILDGTNLSSGLYFYRISAGKFSEVKKMLLLK